LWWRGRLACTSRRKTAGAEERRCQPEAATAELPRGARPTPEFAGPADTGGARRQHHIRARRNELQSATEARRVERYAVLTMLYWLTPYEFSPTLLGVWLFGALLYARGVRKRRVPRARQWSFWTGMALAYITLLTRFDFYALHQFFIDRIQQVVMHHLAPMLIMLAYPLSTWRAALPIRWRARGISAIGRSTPARIAAALLFNPTLATLLFVALVLVWLIPRAMTLAMLDWRLYWLMNASMLVSGLIYWGLVLDHRPRPPARMAPGMRVLSPVLSMTPQIVAGALITFHRTDLYPIFSICGRALDVNVLTDQQIGGLITWIPASMIESVAALIALGIWARLSQRLRGRQRRVRSDGDRFADSKEGDQGHEFIRP